MKKIKLITATVLCVVLSSCGIFKKDCGCPHFGKTQNTGSTVSYV